VRDDGFGSLAPESRPRADRRLTDFEWNGSNGKGTIDRFDTNPQGRRPSDHMLPQRAWPLDRHSMRGRRGALPTSRPADIVSAGYPRGKDRSIKKRKDMHFETLREPASERRLSGAPAPTDQSVADDSALSSVLALAWSPALSRRSQIVHAPDRASLARAQNRPCVPPGA
jgi:hypothetical protein